MTARDQNEKYGPPNRRLEKLPALMMVLTGNETRLGVLLEVGAGVGRVTPIADHLGVARCDVSKHLGKLFRFGLVRPRQREPSAYELAPDVLVRSDETGVEIVVLIQGRPRVRLAIMGEED